MILAEMARVTTSFENWLRRLSRLLTGHDGYPSILVAVLLPEAVGCACVRRCGLPSESLHSQSTSLGGAKDAPHIDVKLLEKVLPLHLECGLGHGHARIGHQSTDRADLKSHRYQRCAGR